MTVRVCRDGVVHGVQSGPSTGEIESRSVDGGCRYRGPPVHSVTVRDDLERSRATTRRRSTSRVRLNTNESPTPPPAAWRDAFAAELSRVEWHRYPDRSAAGACVRRSPTRIGVQPDQVFAANGSNEVLQTLLLAYAGPGRTVATFEPTYQLHGHIARLTGATVVEGERARRLHARRSARPSA